MDVAIRIDGMEAAVARIASLPKQIRYAAARALNDTALQDVRPALRGAMDTQFDRPTPWIKNSVWVDQATRDRLIATIQPRYLGGKGVDPVNVLRAEVQGGARRAKRAEVAFQRVGILPPGWFMVPSASLLADSSKADAYGNVKGSFIVQLLAYFNAFGEQGYRANMTDKRRAQLAKIKRGKSGFLTITGVQYFVSRGKGTYGALPSEGRQGHQQHLPPGIWSRAGIHGGIVKPIFLFVRAPHYPVRYRMGDVFAAAALRGFPARMAGWLAIAVASARGATVAS